MALSSARNARLNGQNWSQPFSTFSPEIVNDGFLIGADFGAMCMLSAWQMIGFLVRIKIAGTNREASCWEKKEEEEEEEGGEEEEEEEEEEEAEVLTRIAVLRRAVTC